MTIPQRLREIAVRLSKPRDGRPWGADDGAADLLDTIAAELEAPAVAMEPDCWAILTPNGSRLVSPQEAAGRKGAYPLYTHAAFASTATSLIDARATVAALQSRIKSLEAENLSLAASQCIVPDGLCGDEGGSQYCSLQQTAAKAGQTSGFICQVPDHCDRITWRNRYYHLPLNAPQPASNAKISS